MCTYRSASSNCSFLLSTLPKSTQVYSYLRQRQSSFQLKKKFVLFMYRESHITSPKYSTKMAHHAETLWQNKNQFCPSQHEQKLQKKNHSWRNRAKLPRTKPRKTMCGILPIGKSASSREDWPGQAKKLAKMEPTTSLCNLTARAEGVHDARTPSRNNARNFQALRSAGRKGAYISHVPWPVSDFWKDTTSALWLAL